MRAGKMGRTEQDPARGKETWPYRIQETCGGIDWTGIPQALREAGMGYYEPERHRRAFENSFATAFVFDGSRLVGFGRVLSDGAYQAALYDVVVLPAWQGRGIGRAILEHLLQKVRDCNAILYANPGKEGFYGRLGFRRLTTGMGRFLRPGRMEEKGMIEPDKP